MLNYHMLDIIKRPIPCHICHNTGSISFLLTQYKIPLLIFNSAKYPTIFCSGYFPSYSITTLKFVTTVEWWECVKKHYMRHMKGYNNIGNFSHIKLINVSHKMTKKVIHYLFSKSTCQQNYTNFFGKNAI